MNTAWWQYLLWIVAAGALGLAQTYILAAKLHLRRRMFLLFYVPITGIFLYGYWRWSGLDLQAASTANLAVGLILAALGAAFLVRNVLSQPASSRPENAQLMVDVIWEGVIYGILDALLLSVLPVHAVWAAFSASGDNVAIQVLIGAGGFAASVLVTAAYHVGYPEFRGEKALIPPIIGNSICSLIYLLSGNLLAPVLAHIAMHVAAVLHGAETTVQLPPHYETASKQRL